jgi:hypothetical protein
MGKSSKATFAQRVDDVKRLLVAGAESSDIRQFAAARGWDVNLPTVASRTGHWMKLYAAVLHE